MKGFAVAELDGTQPRPIDRKQLEEELHHLRSAVVSCFATVLDLKDHWSGRCSGRLADWALWIGQELGVGEDDLHDIQVASLLRDIGKTGVPDAVLQKPSRLDEQELAIVRKHPEFGWAILRTLPGFEKIALYVLHHHEWLNGSGYPSQLVGEEIPLGARIVAVLDAFEAMVSRRTYRTALSVYEAIERLMAISNTHLDPRIVACFVPKLREVAIPSSACSSVQDPRETSALEIPSLHTTRVAIRGKPSNPFQHQSGELPYLASKLGTSDQ